MFLFRLLLVTTRGQSRLYRGPWNKLCGSYYIGAAPVTQSLWPIRLLLASPCLIAARETPLCPCYRIYPSDQLIRNVYTLISSHSHAGHCRTRVCVHSGARGLLRHDIIRASEPRQKAMRIEDPWRIFPGFPCSTTVICRSDPTR
ncbi:unnamed protein product [Trichogramma brassicae]|uniref:Uncharacterized protein n=1 Tax=Trichogramma brassicae TaxID=86971 RepID=A0A6H5INF2_9HYME|nr:unnamed protein product [Trichogramma brassicae]